MKTALTHWFAALLAAGVLPLATGCGDGCLLNSPESQSEAGHAGETAHAGHGDGHGGESAEEEKNLSALTPEEIRAAQCEHNIPMYQCAECCYEVGVVKVDRSLLKGESENGILQLAQAETRKAETFVLVTGEIQTDQNRTVRVTPRISGVVRAAHADRGSVVKAGDVLLEINSVELGAAMGEYEKNLSLAALAQKNHQREKDLWEKKIAAEIDLLAARERLEETRSALRAAEQKLRALGFTDGDFKTAGDSSPLQGALLVRAPLEGTVLARSASVGEAVEAEQELMVLSDLTSLWGWLDVFDRDLDQILSAKRNGDIPVEIRVRAFPDKVFKGSLQQVGPVMEEQTRTVKARAVIDNAEGLLRPGMFCEAKLALAGDREVLAVPKSAVMSDEGADFVFVPFEEGYFRRLDIRKGGEFSDFIEILEGLSPGATVVGEGAFMLKSDVLRSKMGAGCAD